MTAIKMTIQEASEELTGLETLAIQAHYGMDFEKLGGIRTIIGLVWAYESRTQKTDWRTIEKMTMAELSGYFAPMDDPDVIEGKGDRLPGSLNGVSTATSRRPRTTA